MDNVKFFPAEEESYEQRKGQSWKKPCGAGKRGRDAEREKKEWIYMKKDIDVCTYLHLFIHISYVYHMSHI